MKITPEQYKKISHILPTQRGNVEIDNLTLINALLYICENGCKWRGLPSEFGKWNTVYQRYGRWVKNGVIERLYKELTEQRILDVPFVSLKMDSMTVPVHPDACGALKKTESSQ
jgi:transposase